MDRTDLPILLASDLARWNEDVHPLDRIRMQKGVFLLEVKGPPAWANLYHFVAYDWGPYSRELAADIERLIDVGFLEKDPIPTARFHRYSTTSEGETMAQDVWSGLTPREQTFVAAVRGFVTTRSFSRLLRDIYAEYPEYAAKSRFTG
jgi:hypothetical protein